MSGAEPTRAHSRGRDVRRVHLIRHGQTDLNAWRIVQGPRVDAPLSALGHRQARAVAERFAAVPLDGVFSSPLLRARQTAEYVGQHQDPPREVTLLPDLQEYDWGMYCGAPQTGAVWEGMHAVFDAWRAGRLDHAPPDGESLEAAIARVGRGFEAAVAAGATAALDARSVDAPPSRGAAAGDIAIVAHGRILKMLLAGHLARDPLDQEAYPQHNTAVTTLAAHDDGTWRVETLNDTSHRRGLDLPPPGEPLDPRKVDENNA